MSDTAEAGCTIRVILDFVWNTESITHRICFIILASSHSAKFQCQLAYKNIQKQSRNHHQCLNLYNINHNISPTAASVLTGTRHYMLLRTCLLHGNTSVIARCLKNKIWYRTSPRIPVQNQQTREFTVVWCLSSAKHFLCLLILLKSEPSFLRQWGPIRVTLLDFDRPPPLIKLVQMFIPSPCSYNKILQANQIEAKSFHFLQYLFAV